MNNTHFIRWVAFAAQLLPLMLASANAATPRPRALFARPNLVIVYTDEHSFRTLGCYRDLLSAEEAYPWGAGVKVETPHLDTLARDGAITTNFYAASPVCTPSRASFMTGNYPHATGAAKHNWPLKDDARTFAQVLNDKGYRTAYFGKWHLDGSASPGWAPERKFGWEDNRYMWNRGHWKMLRDTPSGPEVAHPGGMHNFDIADAATEENYTTDFLTNKAIEAIGTYGEEPFCVMLSLPDPHGPNVVRAPYDTMYARFKFQEPPTFHKTAEQRQIFRTYVHDHNFIWEGALDQKEMANYFGMVKNIDDNVGRLLDYLQEAGLAENTIVVFTSDHGDLMGEHRRHNKSIPLEASAKVAFLLRYPGRVPAGKRIHKALTSADFAPSILTLMGFEGALPHVHGRDSAELFLSGDRAVHSDAITYIRQSDLAAEWVAAVSDRYKLTLSTADWPWFVDLEQDPSELTNLYRDPAYARLVEQFTGSLRDLMEATDDPSRNLREIRRWLRPARPAFPEHSSLTH
jgi:arylsulfatase A-like enzyme